MPLLVVHGGPGNAEIAEKTFPNQSSRRHGSSEITGDNVSHSNYIALKSTDDMFKGGPEQSNRTEVKLRVPGASIGTSAEWRVQKVKK